MMNPEASRKNPRIQDGNVSIPNEYGRSGKKRVVGGQPFYIPGSFSDQEVEALTATFRDLLDVYSVTDLQKLATLRRSSKDKLKATPGMTDAHRKMFEMLMKQPAEDFKEMVFNQLLSNL